MRRTMMMVIMCAALAMPVVAMADDQTIPPEARWSPTPPVRQTADGNQLASMVVDKGMISPHEHAQLTRPQASSPAPHSHARAWTWEEIDRNPTRSTGGD